MGMNTFACECKCTKLDVGAMTYRVIENLPKVSPLPPICVQTHAHTPQQLVSWWLEGGGHHFLLFMAQTVTLSIV